MEPDVHLFARAVARLNRRLRQERQSELTPTQLSTLATMATLGPCTPGQIAAFERIQPPSVTRTLNGLIDLGLVTRDPHPDDGRQVLVALSEHGITMLAEERDRRDAWLQDRLNGMTPDERRTLHDATELMARLAETE